MIARAVKVTLGPSGRNVLIRDKNEPRPYSTKDGVTVAGQIWSEDPIEMMAIESMQDIANTADEKAGDGTTTATVIGEAIFEAGMKMPENLNLLDVKRGIDEAIRIVVNEIKERSINISDDIDKLKQVALISSNYDTISAEMVTKAFLASGKNGVVRIKRSEDFETYVTTIDGMTIPAGYRSRYYVNDFENDTCVMEEPWVYMTNQKINKMADTNLEFFLHRCAEKGEPVLIICPDMDQAISDMIVRNVSQGSINACVIRCPGFGNEQTEILKDLGAVLGKEPFLENEGIQFDEIDQEKLFDYIPRSEGITVGDQITSIKGVAASTVTDEEFEQVKDKMNARADFLRNQLKTAKTQYEKSQIQVRISRITDGLSYINVGAYSDTEFIEKQGRLQDALYAIKSANEEGIIPGGGAALLSISKILSDADSISKNPSTLYGAKIVADAIRRPFFQIIDNVGIDYDESTFAREEAEFLAGFDAKTKMHVPDMIKAGIIDPAKVTRVALENAGSIAGMLLTTECVVADTQVYEQKNQLPQYG